MVTETEDYAEITAPEAHAESHQDGGSDEINVDALSGELADEQNSAWDKVSGKPDTFPPDSTLAHKDSHEDGGSDEIDVTGLVGTTPRAILGDATPGRVLRCAEFRITDGTNPSTLKCEFKSKWNGDVITVVDNIPKDGHAGDFWINITGTEVMIANSGLTGSALYAIGLIAQNVTGTSFYIRCKQTIGGLTCACRHPTTGVDYDITVLVNSGNIIIYVFYITDA